MWKVADFGLTRTGSSQAQTTRLGQGTPGYRAPELLGDAKSTFTTKADIWAIGCVLYRLVFGKRLFEDDWKAKDWSNSGTPLPRFESDPGDGVYKFYEQSPRNTFLESVITALLIPEPSKRPTAAALIVVFYIGWNFFSPDGAALPPAHELNVFLEGAPDIFYVNHV